MNLFITFIYTEVSSVSKMVCFTTSYIALVAGQPKNVGWWKKTTTWNPMVRMCGLTSLSICTRAKGMLWIEATTGAWSWLSKWWRCWSVWWRDSSGKELRSMRCSVASCLAVTLLMQFLLYVIYRRSTWLPTSRSTWPSSTWRKHLIESHGMSSGGQCAN